MRPRVGPERGDGAVLDPWPLALATWRLCRAHFHMAMLPSLLPSSWDLLIMAIHGVCAKLPQIILMSLHLQTRELVNQNYQCLPASSSNPWLID
jgi:hypothetical protein